MKKDKENKVLFGVCAGLANYFGIDPVLMRLLFIGATFFSFGLPIILYIILVIIMK